MRDHARKYGYAVVLALLGSILTPPGARSAQEVPERDLEKVFELGGVDAPPREAFSHPPALLVDDRERLYARVPGEPEIRVFDPAGEFLGTMGRSGEGPGEFQSIGGFGIIGDSLWVRNFPTPRISLFTLEGEHVRTVRSDVSFGRRFSAPPGITGLLAGGHAYGTPLGNPLGVRRRIEVPILVGDRSLEEPDTVAYRRIPTGMFLPGIGSFSYSPFPVFPLYDAFPQGTGLVLVRRGDASPDCVRVTRYDSSGSPLWNRELTLSTAPVPDDVVREVVTEGVEKAEGPARAARRRGADIPSDLEALVREGLAIPEHYPPVRDVVAGADGTIWLQLGPDLDANRWLALGQNGSPLFQVSLPSGQRLGQATESSVWVTRTDELDVPYIIRYAVSSG